MTDDPIRLEEARLREAEAGNGHGPMADDPPLATEDAYGAVEPIDAHGPNGDVVDLEEFTTPIGPRLTLDPSNPLPSARAFIDRSSP